MTKDYEECRGRLRALVFKTACETRCFDISELESKANELFMEAWYSFDPDKYPNVMFSTWLHTQVKNRLRNFIFRRDPQAEDENAIEKLNSRHMEWHPLKRMLFKEAINGMSEEAQFVVAILLEDPVEILQIDGTESGRHIRGEISRFLLNECEWTLRTIWSTFREIKTTLRRM